MPRKHTIQILSGTTAQILADTPARNELVLNTDNYSLRVGDGTTPGGHLIADPSTATVIERAPKRFLIADTSISNTQLKIKQGTVLTLGDLVFSSLNSDYSFDPTTILDTGSTLTNGANYYLYLVSTDNATTSLVCSLNATTPAGTYTNYKQIGGFHTLCVSVGTITGHPLSDYVAGQILPASVWCLNHWAKHQAGMVYDDITDCWAGIYNMNTSGLSEYNTSRANNLQHFQFVELARANDMELLSDDEFYSFSKGSNQKTTVQGSAQPNPDTTGGRKDTANRRMISWLGCEEMCGLQWQHLRPTSAAGGSNWNSQNGDEGSFYGSAMVLLAGGHWGSSSNCGSRCRTAADSLSTAHSSLGARGRSQAFHTWKTE